MMAAGLGRFKAFETQDIDVRSAMANTIALRIVRYSAGCSINVICGTSSLPLVSGL